jgi:hypothetical protein
MQRRLHRTHPSTIDPFTGVFSPSLVKGFRALLRRPETSEINFNFGSVQVHARSFREVSELFTDRLGGSGLHVVVHPSFLIEENAGAMYLSHNDTIYVSRFDLLDDAAGRGTAIHECVHAICDYRSRNTAIRSEEGAAYVAEAWFRQAADDDDIVIFNTPTAEVIWDVATAARARHQKSGAPVSLRGSEINAVRMAVAQMKHADGSFAYLNDYYKDHDGIAGHRQA